MHYTRNFVMKLGFTAVECSMALTSIVFVCIMRIIFCNMAPYNLVESFDVSEKILLGHKGHGRQKSQEQRFRYRDSIASDGSMAVGF